MDTATLVKLQEVEFSILKDIDNYCKQNNIKYSIYAGTMLGAVRHGGFIPWDDDVDIAMTREEYSKFCECIEKSPMENYSFYNYLNDDTCLVSHGKVGKKGTVFLQEGEKEEIGHHEIWVDVFPLDKIPLDNNYSSETAKLGKKLVFLTRANGNKTNDNLIKRIVRIIVRAIPGRRLRMYKISERLKKLDQQITNNYEWSSMSTLDNIEHIRFPKEMVEKYTTLSFNGESFMSFEDYDGMLRIIYGDYMQLPPKSERVCRHSPIKIQF